MGNLKLFHKQSMRYSLLFIIAVFLVSNIFACHVYAYEAVDLDHDSSDFCHTKKESLISQNRSQDNQKFISDLNSETSEKLSSLIQQKNTFFISSEDLSNSQTTQLLAVVKIE